MPWCASCERYLAPPAVTVDGACPQCGAAVEPAPPRRTTGPASAAAGPEAGSEDPVAVPWHLKVLLGAVALYLGYRAFQLLEWVWRALT